MQLCVLNGHLTFKFNKINLIIIFAAFFTINDHSLIISIYTSKCLQYVHILLQKIMYGRRDHDQIRALIDILTSNFKSESQNLEW